MVVVLVSLSVGPLFNIYVGMGTGMVTSIINKYIVVKVCSSL